jgi:phosphoribosylaminoimidazole-succinocarboxamide synthase
MSADVASPAGFIGAGKVRDLYSVDHDRILLVASDRISAFDVVLPTTIPDKGRVLTALSRFWFAETSPIVPNHLVATAPAALAPESLEAAGGEPHLRGRMMLCRRARVLPVECVVRGYVSGSGWKEYRERGRICGIALPPALRESDRLRTPIFTPATKAERGHHDENIPFGRMVELVGADLAERVREISIALYRHGAARAEQAGLLLADTKFEFGIDLGTGGLMLVDEVMTPDSSRYWDASAWSPGGPQPSFDKQFVRDWLERQPWDKTDPGPALPDDVVTGTRTRYIAAYERITGGSFQRYLEEDVIAR